MVLKDISIMHEWKYKCLNTIIGISVVVLPTSSEEYESGAAEEEKK